jgi:hypothetical protein
MTKIGLAHELAPGIRHLVVPGGILLGIDRICTDVEILYIRRAERCPATTDNF